MHRGPQDEGGDNPPGRNDPPGRNASTPRSRPWGHRAGRRERYEELERSNRTYRTALRLLLHDTRAPLVRVRRTLEGLFDEHPSWSDDLGLARVVEDLDRVDDLLSAVADMERLPSRTDRPQLEVTELSGLIDRIVDEVDHGTHAIRLDVERRSYALDPTLVNLALMNLVTNALTHTPIGSTVWIRAQGRSDELVFVVEDDGPGIAPEHRDAIFEAFQRGNAPDSTPGLGLGLAIVRGIAEGLGGAVSVADRTGGGASLRLVIPLQGSS